MRARILVLMTEGADPEAWDLAAPEDKVTGSPHGCPECPLRPGGEWDAGFAACLPRLSPTTRDHLRGWSCHAKPRPCGGMRRHLRAKE